MRRERRYKKRERKRERGTVKGGREKKERLVWFGLLGFMAYQPL